MNIGLGYALFVSVVCAFFGWTNYGFVNLQTTKPVVCGALVGLILGDLRTGIIIGGTLTLVYMGVQGVGDSGQCHDGDDGNDGAVHYYRRRNGNGDCDRGSGFRYGSAGPDGRLDDQYTVDAYCG